MAIHVPPSQSRHPAEPPRGPGAALEAAGLAPGLPVHWTLPPAALYEHAVRRGEGVITEGGAFCAVTAPHTGRSPNDKFVVRESSSHGDIWWGRVNQPFEEAQFDRLRADVARHLNDQELFVRDLFAGADRNHCIAIRFVTPNAWHTLFVSNMFLRPTPSDLASFLPSWLVLHAPELQADPAVHGTRSGTFIVINFGKRTILIGGTRYAGELKKSVFTILNYLLPRRGVLPMHCSANVGEAGGVARFFGQSGTRKTPPSADPDRGHPAHIVFLTCDAYGIMPPIARLSPAQAMYHFLSGYTAKVAGTERGVTEPKATFSTCFGAPFLPLNANVYASLLGERIARHGVQCWLVNTGWTGGPYGAGQRMRLSHTRAMVRAALAGKLDRIATRPDPVFGLEVPLQVPGVPEEMLLPRSTWHDAAAYDAQATRLARMFRENFEQFQDQVHHAVRDAGPRA